MYKNRENSQPSGNSITMIFENVQSIQKLNQINVQAFLMLLLLVVVVRNDYDGPTNASLMLYSRYWLSTPPLSLCLSFVCVHLMRVSSLS